MTTKKVTTTTTTVVTEEIINESVKAKKTFVAFVLDKSSSMLNGKDITINCFNEQIEIIKNKLAEGDSAEVTLVTFADKAEVMYKNKDIKEVELLNNDNYRPDGWTALYDGIGAAINALKENKDLDDKDNAALVVVFTDGGENASREFQGWNLNTQIKSLEGLGNWTFSVVGPKAGLNSLASILGVKRGNIVGFDPGSLQSRSFVGSTMAYATANYMDNRAKGISNVADFYSSVDTEMAKDVSADGLSVNGTLNVANAVFGVAAKPEAVTKETI